MTSLLVQRKLEFKIQTTEVSTCFYTTLVCKLMMWQLGRHEFDLAMPNVLPRYELDSSEVALYRLEKKGEGKSVAGRIM